MGMMLVLHSGIIRNIIQPRDYLVLIGTTGAMQLNFVLVV